MSQILGFTALGSGATPIVFVHDWFNDSSAYDPVKPYLNTGLYEFIFVDLRGYGTSKNLYGDYSLAEAAQDLVNLADSLNFGKFHIVGHSMGAQIARHVPLLAPGRVASVVAVCPTPAKGYQMPNDVLERLEAVSRNDLEGAKAIIGFMTQNRYDDWFAEREALSWFTRSTPQARKAYLRDFAETDIAALVEGLDVPALAIIGDYDIAAHSAERLSQTMSRDFKNMSLVSLPSGHYPMAEIPITFAAVLSRFWEKITNRYANDK